MTVFRWLVVEALLPAAILSVCVAFRLLLAGHGGDSGVIAYWNDVTPLPLARRLDGAIEGLRLGWPFVIAAPVILWRLGRCNSAIALGLMTILTAAVGLFTANDLSRSTMLLTPAVVLGWDIARRAQWWARYRIGVVMAGVALLLPAGHVVSDFTMPINSIAHEVRLLDELPPLVATRQPHSGS